MSWAFGLLMLAFMAGSTPVRAGSRDAVSAEDLPLIKAALVYNICKFVEWPEAADPDSDFVVVVIGHDEMPNFEIIESKPLHGRPVRVVELEPGVPVPDCQLLYMAYDHEDDAHVPPAGTLTVGDRPGFAAGGGMVELMFEDGRLRFVLNKGVAHDAELELSSQLLKIAKSVLK